MKLLFDENLPPKLARVLASLFPGSRHVRECGLRGHADDEIWEHAYENNFVLVSKDSDFQRHTSLYGHPPKVLWLRTGNCTTQQLVGLITAHKEDIETFGAQSIDAIFVLR